MFQTTKTSIINVFSNDGFDGFLDTTSSKEKKQPGLSPKDRNRSFSSTEIEYDFRDLDLGEGFDEAPDSKDYEAITNSDFYRYIVNSSAIWSQLHQEVPLKSKNSDKEQSKEQNKEESINFDEGFDEFGNYFDVSLKHNISRLSPYHSLQIALPNEAAAFSNEFSRSNSPSSFKYNNSDLSSTPSSSSAYPLSNHGSSAKNSTQSSFGSVNEAVSDFSSIERKSKPIFELKSSVYRNNLKSKPEIAIYPLQYHDKMDSKSTTSIKDETPKDNILGIIDSDLKVYESYDYDQDRLLEKDKKKTSTKKPSIDTSPRKSTIKNIDYSEGFENFEGQDPEFYNFNGFSNIGPRKAFINSSDMLKLKSLEIQRAQANSSPTGQEDLKNPDSPFSEYGIARLSNSQPRNTYSANNAETSHISRVKSKLSLSNSLSAQISPDPAAERRKSKIERQRADSEINVKPSKISKVPTNSDKTPINSPSELNSAKAGSDPSFNLEIKKSIAYLNDKKVDPKVRLDLAIYLLENSEKVLTKNMSQHQAKAIMEYIQVEVLRVIKRISKSRMGSGKLHSTSEALFYLGSLYSAGKFEGKNPEKAFELYLSSAKLHHIEAMYRTAVCYEIGSGAKKNYQYSIQYYRKAAAAGHIRAMYKLGLILLNGLLNQPNQHREAVTWLKRAAEDQSESAPYAMYELAVCYESREIPGLINDKEYAKELYLKSAKLGYVLSMKRLAIAYEYGELGVGHNPQKSVGWYKRAAGYKDAESEFALSIWYFTGAPPLLPQDDKQAFFWAEKAALGGLPKGMCVLGYYYEFGIGTAVSRKKAVFWYTQSSLKKHLEAAKRLKQIELAGNSSAIPLLE